MAVEWNAPPKGHNSAERFRGYVERIDALDTARAARKLDAAERARIDRYTRAAEGEQLELL